MASVGRPQAMPSGFAVSLSPFSLMRRMADDMDRIFQDFGLSRGGLGVLPSLGSAVDRDLWRGASAVEAAAWVPELETFKRGNRFVVRADLPGVRKEDVHVDVRDNVLMISGERRSEQEEKRDDFYRSERSYGRFFRAMPLPEGVNADDVEASFKDGVLEVSFAASSQGDKKSKQIQIR